MAETEEKDITEPGGSSMDPASVLGMVEGGAETSSMVGDAMDFLSDPMGVQSMMTSMMAIKDQKQAQANFDKQFEEQKRQFGLTFALKEWATRKNVDMAQARMLYNQKLSGQTMRMSKATTRESLKGAAQQRMQAQKQFNWEEQDRDKQQTLGKAYSSGLMKGIGGI